METLRVPDKGNQRFSRGRDPQETSEASRSHTGKNTSLFIFAQRKRRELTSFSHTQNKNKTHTRTQPLPINWDAKRTLQLRAIVMRENAVTKMLYVVYTF